MVFFYKNRNNNFFFQIVFLYLLIIITLHSCDLKNPLFDDKNYEEAITGGREVKSSDVLAHKIVMIFSKAINREFNCTGVILDSKTILTAAHCTVVGKQDLEVFFGFDLRNTKKSGIEVVDIETPSEYFQANTSSEYDIALLRLKEAIPSEYSFANFFTARDLKDSQVYLYGYGLVGLSADKIFSGGVLRWTKSWAKFEDFFKNTGIKKNTFVIDQRSGRGICLGDSGGPVFVKKGFEYQVVGINTEVFDSQNSQSTKSDENLSTHNFLHKKISCKEFGRALFMPYFLNWLDKAKNLLVQREELRKLPAVPQDDN